MDPNMTDSQVFISSTNILNTSLMGLDDISWKQAQSTKSVLTARWA